MIQSDDLPHTVQPDEFFLEEAVEKILEQQRQDWPLVKDNYAALTRVETKKMEVEGFEMLVQFNPSRILSSGAKVDAASIQKRACFLCRSNRPLEQKEINWRNQYWLLVNPFPIFPQHLTIASMNHVDQRIAGHFMDMLQLSEQLPSFVLFYNGPRCGASAPDHLHFQAGNKGFLPMEYLWESRSAKAENLKQEEGFWLRRLQSYPHAVLMMESTNEERLEQWFDKIYRLMPTPEEDAEPMMNVLCTRHEQVWRVWIFLREKHRPSCYFADNEHRLLISPAAVDLSGVIITPRYEDFQKITDSDLATVFHEVSLNEAMFDQLCASLCH
ncbi:MAG: DUF4922 domain-containing protein [Microbacter sp.]